MAKIINNRIYLDQSKDFASELREAARLKVSEYPIIVIEDEYKHNNKYKIQIEANNIDREKICDYWIYIFSLKSNDYKYAQLGTWNDQLIEQEIRHKFNVIKEEKYPNQSEFKIKRSKELNEYIINQYKSENGALKWFNVYLSDDEQMEKTKFISSHYGAEIYSFGIDFVDIETLLNKLDGLGLFVRITELN